MPLSSCPECSGQLSSHAHTCPHCGMPFRPAGSATTVSTVTWGVFLGLLCFSAFPLVLMVFFAGVVGSVISS